MPYANTPEGRQKKRERAAIYRAKYRDVLREKGRQRGNANYAANPEKFKQIAKARYHADPSKSAKACAKWRRANREHCNAYTRERRAQNPELFRRYRQHQKDKDPEKFRLRDRIRGNRYFRRYPERKNAYRKQWRHTNPAKTRLEKYRRRTLESTCSGTFSYEQFMWRCEFFGWHCRYCRCELTLTTVTVDHQIPLSRGGTNWPSNLVPACRSCNCRKQRRTFFEYQAIITCPANP